MSLPVIFIAFANDNYSSSGYLRNLPIESIGLRKLMLEAEEHKLCEYLIIENATFDHIVQVFQQAKYRDRIAVFHFAGHAGSEQLFLKNAAGENQASYEEGLVSFLANQHSLELVFLNGCHTQAIGQALSTANIPAVIGTSAAVKDNVATDLSIYFYKGLSRGLNLARAWKDAVSQLTAKELAKNPYHFYRSSDYREDMAVSGGPTFQFPWSLNISSGKELVNNWSLPIAANNPLFGLPSIDNQYDLLNEPFAYLKKYEEKEARNFFGRGEYIQHLFNSLTNTQAPPLLLLHGQSGVGKSSLLKAGLLPRLSIVADTFLRKRSREHGLSTNLRVVLNEIQQQKIGSNNDKENLLDIWHAIEAATQRPLIIILDQVEEAFTKPRPTNTQELQDFFDLVYPIFSNKTTRPKGKLVLSYRKEYAPEIVDMVKKTGLTYKSIFLKKMGEYEIQEVVNGLSSSPAHREQYQVNIEEDLPKIIAADLLKDSSSPIAPVLQILLTKLWQQAQLQEPRVFSRINYNTIQNKGIFLESFFKEQLATLKLWSQKHNLTIVDSGLALDLLNYHTTTYGTAENRSFSELKAQYSHHQELLPNLIQQLKSLYLLADGGSGHTSLAHDTLAPIIHHEIRLSDKPGQRALRLLTTKVLDYKQNPSHAFLEKTDLATVEIGKPGMRVWSTVEQKIVSESSVKRKIAQAKRKRIQLIQRGLVSLLAIASLLIFYSWQQSKQQATGNEWVSKALQMEQTNPTQSLAMIEKALAHLPDPSLALQARHDIYSNNEFYDTLIHLDDEILAIELSNDNQQFILATGQEVQIRNATNLDLINTLEHQENVRAIAFSNNNNLFATAAEDYTLKLWDSAGKLIQDYSTNGLVQDLAFSPDNQMLLVSDDQGEVNLWNLDGTFSLITADFAKDFEAVAFSTFGDTLLIGNGNGEIQFHNHNGELLQSIKAHDDRILSLTINNSNGNILSTSRDATSAIWSPSGQLIKRMAGHEERVNAGRWLNSNQSILTASDDNKLILWDSKSGTKLRTYRAHLDFVNDFAVSAQGDWFLSVGSDSVLVRWYTESKVNRIISANDDESFTQVALSGNGELLMAGTKASIADNEIDDPFFDFFAMEDAELSGLQSAIIWDSQGTQIANLDEHNGRINTVAIANDNQFFLSGTSDGKAFSWNLEGDILQIFEHDDEINSVAISPNGKQILTGSSDNTAILWSAETGEQLEQLVHNDLVSDVLFSIDGQHIYSASFDETIRVFNTKGELIREMTGHTSRVSCLAIRSDGTLLSGDWDNQLIHWSKHGDILSTYHINSKNSTGGTVINAIAISPISSNIAIAAEGGLIQVLTENSRLIQTIKTDEECTGLAFTPDGAQLISSEGSTIRYHKLIGD